MLTEAQRAMMLRIDTEWELVANGSCLDDSPTYWWRDEAAHVERASTGTVRSLLRLGYLRWGYARPGRLPVGIVTPAGHRAQKPPRIAGLGSG